MILSISKFSDKVYFSFIHYICIPIKQSNLILCCILHDDIIIFNVLAISRFDMCGQIVIGKLPDSIQGSANRRVIYYPQGKGSDAESVSTGNDNKFCAKVKPGKYVVKVEFIITFHYVHAFSLIQFKIIRNNLVLKNKWAYKKSFL